jgi:type IV pilus assembly protein PilW
MMGIELANAGNGLAVAAQALGTCTAAALMKDSLRPIPLLITAVANDSTPDSFVIYYSVARTLIAPALFTSAAAANADYVVQSANGFKKGDLIVAITNPTGAGDCYSSRITDTVPAPDVNGIVTIVHTGTPAVGASATLFNLGPSNLVQKVRYDVSGGNLRSTSLLDPDGVPSTAEPVNPIASNVLNVKLQYGIDTAGDGLVHHWVPAVAGTAYGDWDPATLLAAPVATLNRIKAARIAVLVRSEQHDKELAGQGFNYPVFNDCADDAAGGCGVTFNIPAVSAATQPYGWRYRVYETVIPLRNEVWNKEV